MKMKTIKKVIFLTVIAALIGLDLWFLNYLDSQDESILVYFFMLVSCVVGVVGIFYIVGYLFFIIKRMIR